MNKTKIGVVLGRFQSNKLHEGHIKLIEEVQRRSDGLIILIGSDSPRITKKNPLSYEARALMVQSMFPNAHIQGVADFKSNEHWATNIDNTIDRMLQNLIFTDTEITIYGSRDSSLPFYFFNGGKYKTEELISETPHISATEDRVKIASTVIDSEDFRSGCIHTTLKRYDICYPTVDIAVINHKYQVLLGRKEYEDKFRFIGGFVDPTDASLEAAAYRECREEAGEDICLFDFTYIGSLKINDWRYRGCSDGIMTSFFLAKYEAGEIKASDDIVDAQFVNIYDLSENDIVEEHRPLWVKFKEFLTKKF